MLQVLSLLTCLYFFSGCNRTGQGNPESGTKVVGTTHILKVELVTAGLTSPVGIVNANDKSGTLFIVQQNGLVRIIKNGRLLPEPFLDIQAQMVKLHDSYSEEGLLGLAFDPQYVVNHKLYAYYSKPSSSAPGFSHDNVLEQFTVSANPDLAEPNGKILLTIHEPASNHQGGQLAFGPDKYLYLGVGDGGGEGDHHGTIGNGQNTYTWLGKILRINVDTTAAYGIPSDNPFAKNKKGLPEIFAYGLRNPWRFSFDSQNGRLICGDVGQNKYEEIDIITKEKNYGWRLMEGLHCYNPPDCDTTGLTLPVFEYSHDMGKCVIGGYIYRGSRIPSLQGVYVFGDWTGKIFLLKESKGQWVFEQPAIEGLPDGFTINSFGTDESGEIYIAGQSQIGAADNSGAVYKIVSY